MLIVDFDDELKEILDNLISGMLPHENFNKDLFSDIYESITRYIHIDEMSLEYRILFNIFEDVLKINVLTGKYEPIVTFDFLENALQVSLLAFISEEGYRFKDWFEQRGVNSNFNIPSNVEDGGSVLYNEVCSLYTRCFDKQLPSSHAIPYIANYRNLFLDSVGRTLVSSQATILQDKLYHDGRYYKSSEDWLDFTTKMTSEILSRTNDELFNSSEHLDSLDKIEALLVKSKTAYIPLANYGIDPIDEATPMLAHRLTVVCGRENTGKTKYACYLAANMIMANMKVVYMCGESTKEDILNNILSNYIYKKYKRFVTARQIAGADECSEEALRLIRIAASELTSSGCLTLRESFSYENLYNELVSMYETRKFDGLFIDHSNALRSIGRLITERERIDKLAVDLREFKKSYPVYVCVTSHLSVEAGQELSKTGTVREKSPTAGSTKLSREADEVFVLSSNDDLEQQEMRALHTFKRRGGKRNLPIIILKVLFNCGEWVYDRKNQDGKFENLEVSAAYSQIEQTYLDEEDGELEMDFD